MRFPIALALSLALIAPAVAAAQSLPAPPFPPENPITEAKRILGKALFWDEQLSSDNTDGLRHVSHPERGRLGPARGHGEPAPRTQRRLR